MLSIDNLPDEVLAKIISNFTLSERKTLKLVNHHWLDVCNHVKFGKYEQIKMKSTEMHLLQIPRRYLNIEIDDGSSNSASKDGDPSFQRELQNKFWIQHGSSVRCITIQNFQRHCQMIHKILNWCQNVVELKLLFSGESPVQYETYHLDILSLDGKDSDDGDEENNVMEGECAKLNFLKNLVILGMTNRSFIIGDEFLMLTASVSKLKRLELYNVYVDSRPTYWNKAMLSLIRKQALTLTELLFFHCEFVTDSFLEKVLEKIGPQLTGLYLNQLPVNSLECLWKNADRLLNLKDLGICRMDLIQISSLRKLLSFKNLQFIDLRYMYLSVDAFMALGELENLKGLDLSSVKCSAEAILTGFGEREHPNIVDLRMQEMFSLTDDVLLQILPHFPNLRCLDVSLNYKITTIAAQAILTNCQQLTHLAFRCCPDIKNLMEPTNINILQNLVYLDMSLCKNLEPRLIPNLSFAKLRAVGFPGVVFFEDDLEVPFVPFSEDCLNGLLEHCPQLNRVYLGPNSWDHVSHYEALRDSDIFTFSYMVGQGSIFEFSKN